MPQVLYAGYINLLLYTTGHYIYIEASAPRAPGQKARVLSPTLPSSSGECLQFYYHMYGAGMGTLNVYTQVGAQQTNIWTRKGNQGNKWLLGQVTLKNPSSFKVGNHDNS